MTRRPILVWGDPCLTRAAAPVGRVTAAVQRLAEDLAETMYDAHGRGLAAPQVGESLAVFVVDCHWKDGAPRAPLTMIDPRLLWASEEMATREEGCLSIPDLPMPVTRPSRVRFGWTGLDGASREAEFAGIEAVCVQHEFDHLRGVLIPDHVAPEVRAELAPRLAEIAARGGTV